MLPKKPDNQNPSVTVRLPGWTARMAVLAASLAVGVAAAPTLKLQVHTASPDGFLVTSAILTGPKSAGLVDGQFLLAEGEKIVQTLKAAGKPLAWIYVTHAHPDHHFGLDPLRRAFPEARILAAPEVIAQMKAEAPHHLAEWKPKLKGALTDDPIIPEAYDGDTLDLDGARIELHRRLAADSDPTTLVYVPSLKAAICGDIAYNDTHVWLAETDAAGRTKWLATLDKVAALKPEIVVAGHREPSAKDGPKALAFTRKYIQDFEKAVQSTRTAGELTASMMKAYPKAALPVILDIASKAAKPAAKEAGSR